MPLEQWVASCAKQLKCHWRTVDPDQLEELAADLARDARLRAMHPISAALTWQEPVLPSDDAKQGV
ncbi:hypothetical protein [Variovorax sp. PAMC26660]|uniref:hypothetical protein n=1 Tax=Variovorax sp. PAMC26660 TaxID=2762322 RepID=UPI0021C487D7|nr:hypothetical protein [Variovorax sp. PAMC26660]